MKVSFYSTNKLREFLRHKDLYRVTRSRSVVYKISYKNCDASYVGQTYKQLRSKITEHKNPMKCLFVMS